MGATSRRASCHGFGFLQPYLNVWSFVTSLVGPCASLRHTHNVLNIPMGLIGGEI
ncbi:hypothetical protein KC19_N028700 [Ceratodon purpureus]|nr:hypothetical protein KC19_N043100 [Ceratodon purpureus]KAG0504478.1 hypothetical protein KC19_N029800 [Ceratodon purpureus]KAG0504482.1 hypothetical protein KC19_N028700 [Ceratodon purpureus]